jgi:predicted RNA binding protein YcfA (HicA-like mRNA interferase family)
MTGRKDIYDSLKRKLEAVGFQFEKVQKPHLQNRKENELKFIHPQLIKKLEEDGYKVNAKKFYLVLRI